MTITDTASFTEAMDVLHAWHANTGQGPPMAIWCAEAHPLAPDVLCRRLDGHGGVHAADARIAWVDVDKSHDPDRRTP